jgi:hypothetical protein
MQLTINIKSDGARAVDAGTIVDGFIISSADKKALAVGTPAPLDTTAAASVDGEAHDLAGGGQ